MSAAIAFSALMAVVWQALAMTDPRWGQLVAARRSLIAEFADRGVEHVEYVASLPDPEVWVWLGTTSDAERDCLATSPGLLEQVRRVLADEVDGIELTGVTVQSDETVRRDFDGRWFYALR